jgi:hypothetical protein
MSTMPIQKKKKLPPGSIIPDTDGVPAEVIQRMRDKEESEKYLKANPDIKPSTQPYKDNAEYLKEEELNRERMKRSKRYSETLKELENPKKKAE